MIEETVMTSAPKLDKKSTKVVRIQNVRVSFGPWNKVRLNTPKVGSDVTSAGYTKLLETV